MFYKKRIARPDTAAQAAERETYRRACVQALLDTRKRFPILNEYNLEAADRYRKQRIETLIVGRQ